MKDTTIRLIVINENNKKKIGNPCTSIWLTECDEREKIGSFVIYFNFSSLLINLHSHVYLHITLLALFYLNR